MVSGSVVKGKGQMGRGEVLKQGITNALYSPNTIYMIILMTNGELQVRKGGLTLWKTNIYAPNDLKGCYARLEAEGLVIRDQ